MSVLAAEKDVARKNVEFDIQKLPVWLLMLDNMKPANTYKQAEKILREVISIHASVSDLC